MKVKIHFNKGAGVLFDLSPKDLIKLNATLQKCQAKYAAMTPEQRRKADRAEIEEVIEKGLAANFGELPLD